MEAQLGEIRMVSFNFAPRGWAQCDGQLLPINQNQALFSLLGTTYGGDGRTTFALPDLRGRSPLHVGSSNYGGQYSPGQRSGSETHTLSGAELPPHTHGLKTTSAAASLRSPVGAVYGATAVSNYHSWGGGAGGVDRTMSVSAVAAVGGGQPHENRQPYLVINFVIALQGVFPSSN
ncbi:phage tail protein [Paenibacillus sp. J5C2022]|uniref:phage tail protein n=1 Tax=Paenibacillus sp. J5C2022 TaxID=2977129 RepID=UPI00293EEAC7|nr:tail fiber protein [Paenibacillus sp. J5C2022]